MNSSSREKDKLDFFLVFLVHILMSHISLSTSDRRRTLGMIEPSLNLEPLSIHQWSVLCAFNALCPQSLFPILFIFCIVSS